MRDSPRPKFCRNGGGRAIQFSRKEITVAIPGRRWEPSDFAPNRNLDPARAIAEFAVRYGVDVVLAATHLLEENVTQWRKIDTQVCEELRLELDRLGGQNIAIDYQLITTNAILKDEASRHLLLADIGSLPLHNLWLRISGFGATATGVGTRQFIEAVREFHELGRPLVADAVGGFAGLAAAAFGAVAGISHGIGQRKVFMPVIGRNAQVAAVPR